MNEFELIENYLKGRLQGQALRDFEDRLASNSNFASKVEEHKVMQDMLFTKGLIETREKLQAIRKIKSANNGGTGGWFKGISFFLLSLVVFSSIYVFFNEEKISENKKTETNTVSKEIVNTDDTIKPQEEGGNKNFNHQALPFTKINSGRNIPVETVDSIRSGIIKIIAADSQVINTKDQNLSEEPKTVLKNPQEEPCANVNIKAKMLTEESCQDKATGKLHLSQITGGTAPYRFSLNNSESLAQNIFDDLQAGKHQVRITDLNGCSSRLEVNILSKPCQSNIFSPDYGETWMLPISTSGNCTVRIYDASGAMVYEVNTSNGHPSEWNGTGSNQSYMKAGAYLYQVRCDDGMINQGSVTITR